MEITRGKISGAKKVLVYGPEGIGKTTFAASFPDPLFIDTEGSTKELDVMRLPAPSSWTMIKEEARYVIQHPEVCKTLVIDTADWAEKMAIQAVLDEHQKNGIEDFGYGNGYRYVYEKFGELLNILNDVVKVGINVVMTAHAIMKKFEQPDELGAYDRYTMKLIDSPKTSINAAVKEWADMVLFANYKTIVVTDSKTKISKAQGGARVMYTSHHSCWDAKNRYGLQDELPFDYKEIKAVIEKDPGKKIQHEIHKNLDPKPAPAPSPAPETKATEEPLVSALPETQSQPADFDIDKRIPKQLRDLMIHDGITEWDIENYTSEKGYVPADAKIWDYERINPGIIDGLFVAQWTTVRDKIRAAKKQDMVELPFN